jgi:hypothetical protein
MKLKYLLTIALLAVAPTARAGIFEKCMGFLAGITEKPFLETIENPEGEAITLYQKGARYNTVTLDLGKKLGAGFFGTALVVRAISDSSLEQTLRNATGAYFDGSFVVKMPHAPRGGVSLGRPWFFANQESHRELKTYEMIRGKLPTIEAHAAYPANAPFQRGRMPAVPISGSFESERGLLLFKMMLKGKGLKELAVIARDNGGALPEPYRSGLKAQFDFVQAVYHTVRAPGPLMGLLEGQPFSVDMRPPNLVWVDDAATLAALGYFRPGFVSFEMSAVPLNRPVYIESEGMSFEGYLAEYRTYLERELAENTD